MNLNKVLYRICVWQAEKDRWELETLDRAYDALHAARTAPIISGACGIACHTPGVDYAQPIRAELLEP